MKEAAALQYTAHAQVTWIDLAINEIRIEVIKRSLSFSFCEFWRASSCVSGFDILSSLDDDFPSFSQASSYTRPVERVLICVQMMTGDVCFCTAGLVAAQGQCAAPCERETHDQTFFLWRVKQVSASHLAKSHRRMIYLSKWEFIVWWMVFALKVKKFCWQQSGRCTTVGPALKLKWFLQGAAVVVWFIPLSYFYYTVWSVSACW